MQLRRPPSISNDINATAPTRARLGPWSLDRCRVSVSNGPVFVQKLFRIPESESYSCNVNPKRHKESQRNVRSGDELPVTSKIKVTFCRSIFQTMLIYRVDDYGYVGKNESKSSARIQGELFVHVELFHGGHIDCVSDWICFRNANLTDERCRHWCCKRSTSDHQSRHGLLCAVHVENGTFHKLNSD